MLYQFATTTLAAALTCGIGVARADDFGGNGNNGCRNLPGYNALKSALAAATATETSGLNNQMWGTIVDRDGIVCAVAFTGNNRAAQWPGSRVISAQKANTANAFSLDASSNSGGSGQRTVCRSLRRTCIQRAAGRQPVWLAGKQSRGYRGGL